MTDLTIASHSYNKSLLLGMISDSLSPGPAAERKQMLRRSFSTSRGRMIQSSLRDSSYLCRGYLFVM